MEHHELFAASGYHHCLCCLRQHHHHHVHVNDSEYYYLSHPCGEFVASFVKAVLPPHLHMKEVRKNTTEKNKINKIKKLTPGPSPLYITISGLQRSVKLRKECEYFSMEVSYQEVPYLYLRGSQFSEHLEFFIILSFYYCS